MAKDALGFFEMFLVCLLKDPGGLAYVFIITHEIPTLVPVDGPTLSVHRIFILGLTSMFLMVLFPLKWVWIP